MTKVEREGNGGERRGTCRTEGKGGEAPGEVRRKCVLEGRLAGMRH